MFVDLGWVVKSYYLCDYLRSTGVDSIIDSRVNSMDGLELSPEKAVFDLATGPLPKAVKALEWTTVQFPTDQDFHFYSNFQAFKQPVANLQSRVVSLLGQLGSLTEVTGGPSTFPSEPDEAYDWLVGVQDELLERVDASLDRFQLERKDQLKQKPELSVYEAISKQNLSRKVSHSVASEHPTSGDVKVARSKGKSTIRSPIPFHIPSISRPQDKFDDPVDNSNTPFRHPAPKGRNQEKSQASSQSHQETVEISPGVSSVLSSVSPLDKHAGMLGLKGSKQNAHPLEEELRKMAYVEGLLDTVEITKYESLYDTPFTFVATLQALKEMASKLRVAGEIAVDLENHHYRSYQGFVCLMQVSTRNEDFVVDTLDLRSQIGPCLGDIFADPTVRKVMHGADHDIVWLQRDFGIYVCNLFDTGQAARVLQLPGFGLAFLLEHFCGIHADKRYQLADWRIRPLPSEMLKYAREDTHYLLYMHDMLKQQLLAAKGNENVDEEDPCFQVYKRSRDICLQLYSKDLYTETSYQQLYGLQEKKLEPDQLVVLMGLHAWRDQVSRREDESTGYVLPNHLLFQLASEMPDSVRQIVNIAKGSHSFLGRNASIVIEIIHQAREKARRDKVDAVPEQEQRAQSGSFLEQNEAVGDKSEVEVINIDSTRCQDGYSELVGRSSQNGGDKAERHIPSNVSEADSLVNQSMANMTIFRLSKNEGDASGPEAMRNGQPDCPVGGLTTSGTGQQKPEVLPGPVVVSRRTSSSFFNIKSGKVAATPTEDHHPPASLAVSEGTTVLGSGDLATSTTLAMKNEGLGSSDGQVSVHLKNIPVTEAWSMEIETDSSHCLTGKIAVDSDQFSVPRICQAGRDEDIRLCAPAPVKSTISAHSDHQKDKEEVLVVKKKPSRFGALLGASNRLQQHGPGQSAKDLDELQVRIKTHAIESSLVLPFSPSFHVAPNASRMDAQLSASEESNLSIARAEENLKRLCESPDDTIKPSNEGTEDQQACNTAPQWPDVLMFESETDIVRPNGGDIAGNGVAVQATRRPKDSRKWWPPAPGLPSIIERQEEGSPLTMPQEVALDQPFEHGTFKTPDLPLSLSEVHSHSKSSRRNRSPVFSSAADNPRVAVTAVESARRGGTKRRGREKSVSPADAPEVKRAINHDSTVSSRSFSYRDARNAMGLGDFYDAQVEDRQGTNGRGGRGRGSKIVSNKPNFLLNKSAFDPLRRSREEPRPEGIKPGQRRQVFPQTGNRTAVFKQ